MKGIVFTELMEMVENVFGFDVLDNVIEKSNLENDGIFVAGGTYPHSELVKIVVALSEETKMEVPALLQAYGKHLFGRLIGLYPQFAEGKNNPLEFIASVDGIIHIEVRKLYPDAELPEFHTISHEEDTLVVDYVSGRKMEDFAIGLMLGCSDHYKQEIDIQHEPVADKEEHTIRFTIKLK